MLHAGDVLAQRYRLRERVGGGGMGDVWRGEDTVLGRTVAVKVLRADRSQASNFRERFRREARAIAALDGPGIVEVFDYGEANHHDHALAFLVMRYVDGMSLSRRLSLWGRIDVLDTLEIVAQVADSLDVAHHNGIIHRDVKPGNILVPDDGRVTLVDFGIARANVDITLTTAGVILGTVRYMSPEQAAGQRLSFASDVYSLGVVAHQCLTGDPPFKADSPLAVLSAHMRGEPPRLPASVAPGVRDLITKAMASQPEHRFSSAAELAGACRALLRRPATIVSPPARPKTGDGVPVGRSQVFEASGRKPRPVPPAVPPDASTATGTAVVPPRRRGRGRWFLWSIVLLLATVIGLVLLVEPGSSPTSLGHGAGRGEDPRPRTSGSIAGSDGRAGQDQAESGTTGSARPGSGSSSETGQSTGSSQPNPSPRVTKVPDVMHRPESPARTAITEADLQPSVVYQGEGELTCDVVAQDPAAGEEVSPQSTVTLTVRRATETC